MAFLVQKKIEPYFLDISTVESICRKILGSLWLCRSPPLLLASSEYIPVKVCAQRSLAIVRYMQLYCYCTKERTERHNLLAFKLLT